MESSDELTAAVEEIERLRAAPIVAGSRRFSPHYIDLRTGTFELSNFWTWSVFAIFVRSLLDRSWKRLIVTSGDRVLCTSEDARAVNCVNMDPPSTYPIRVEIAVDGEPMPRGVELIVIGETNAPPMSEAMILELMRYADKAGDQRRRGRSKETP